MRRYIWMLGTALLAAQGANAADALVYRGPGSCAEGCSQAAALMAQKAGLNPVYVGPKESDPHLFDHAAVWIQPGGTSTAVGRAMTDTLKQRIRDFVAGGGAYVGFCAGGFFATERIGETRDSGLGLIPGSTALYDQVSDDAHLLTLNWAGQSRIVYWEGGPAFYPPIDTTEPAQVTATYPDGSAVSVRAPYGLGRVYVTGAHPEAPASWDEYFHFVDADGLDYDLAVDMIRWAARLLPEG